MTAPHHRRPLKIATTAIMASLFVSTSAFVRPHFRAFSVGRLARCRQRHSSRMRNPTQTGVEMLLGVETSAGLLGLGALGAMRAFTSSITPKRVRVVTDIDDTVKSSGNKRLLGIPLGGIDAQYSRGKFYPGVFQFSLELARYRVPSWQEPLSVAVLTARAREFLFALEIGDSHEISMEFRKCGDRNNLKAWGRGPVLYGSVKEWICGSRKSLRKARNFAKLVEDDGQGGHGRPGGAEGGYVFVGDTGEGDARAGELMSVQYPERLRAVFLHVVSDTMRQDTVGIPVDKEVNNVPVVYFRTYVGAAVKAVQLGLMDKAGLENVIADARQALSAVPQTSSKWKDLNQDIAMALGAEVLLPPLTVETVMVSVEKSGTLTTKATDAGNGSAGTGYDRDRSRITSARRREGTLTGWRRD